LPPMLHCAKPRPHPSLEPIQVCLNQAALAPVGTGGICGLGIGLRERDRFARKRVKMNALLQEYLPLVIFIGVSLVIGLALLIAPFIVAYQQPDPEKLSAYECGFNAFDDARMKFDVRFYLVAILFIIFDLEVSFLFPWAVAFGQIGAFGFWSMMVFLAVLTIGFIYEWKKGALEWD
jgi:NADH-quinone oxidoreductase subunit A